LVSAGMVSFFGASNVIATLMEGLRRAEGLPDMWTFWERRRRAFRLVLLSLVPLAIVSILVVFGHAITAWLASSFGREVQATIYVTTILVRWVIALGASVSVIGLLYHQGVPDPSDGSRRGAAGIWRAVLPGAVMATLMWFFTTLLFGWYVTRFANYSEVYGSLGAGIALLFWLYIISFSVLCGAEFNVQFGPQFQAHFGQTGAAVWLRGRRHARPSQLDKEPKR
jgi:membrane protein